jgi:hypothetical protein
VTTENAAMTIAGLLEILTDADPQWIVPGGLPITIAALDGTKLGHVVDASATLRGENRHFTLHVSFDSDEADVIIRGAL